MALSKIDSDGIVSGGITADSLNIGQIGGRRNIAYNGAMKISQRGTSFDFNASSSAYTLDRFAFEKSATDQLVANVSQVSDSPDGFANSLKYTTSTAETTAEAGEFVRITQKIEGQDIQQFKYGTSDAQTVTLSFWVKSSITGTYAVSIYCDHSAQARLYGDTYTINSANTWEYKTITITGDTVGIPDDDNGENFRLQWFLDAGSSYTSTDNTSWINYAGTGLAYGHGVRTLVTTTNATWQITGVQLEVGTVATPFEHRSYGEELALCQRYYYRMDGRGFFAMASKYTTNQIYCGVSLPVSMRSNPTLDSASGANYYRFYADSDNDYFDNWSGTQAMQEGSLDKVMIYDIDSAHQITDNGKGGWVQIFDTSAYIAFNAEL